MDFFGIENGSDYTLLVRTVEHAWMPCLFYVIPNNGKMEGMLDGKLGRGQMIPIGAVSNRQSNQHPATHTYRNGTSMLYDGEGLAN